MLISKRDYTTVFEVFPEKYRDLICGYIDRINSLFSRYDAVIFMARKAYCFYLALTNNGLIDDLGTCEVYSSRALSYDLKSKLLGKNIALVDDIVVKGTTLENALSQLVAMNQEKRVDIYIAACRNDKVSELTGRVKNQLQGSFAHLDSVSILELTKCIAAYISLSTISYNADGPRYNAQISSFDQIEWILRDYGAADISSPLQKKHGVLNCVFHVRSSVLKLHGLDEDISKQLIENVIVKFRLLYNKQKQRLTVLPIVLLPALKCTTIYRLASCLFSEHGTPNDSCCQQDYIKLLSMIRYQLERELMEAAFTNRYCITFEYDYGGEYSQFGSAVPISEDRKLLSIDRNIVFQSIPCIDAFEINELIEKAYDFLLNDTWEAFTDVRGVTNKFFTLEMLRNKLVTDEQDSFLNFSLVMDILIDKGLIIPEYVFDENNHLVRAYRTGEVMSLTHNEICVLATFLHIYYELVNRPLDRVELEKLCVILYRYCHKRNIFQRDAVGNPNNTSQDYYDICYTRYGPRISNSDCKYEIKGENACITRNMVDEGYLVQDDQRKYHAHSDPSIPEYYQKHEVDFYTLATVTADLATNLSVISSHCQDKIGDNLVETANDLFTLIAIGEDLKSQVLSLIAEIRLFANIAQSSDPTELLKRIGTVIDGVWSGIWKHKCFETLDIRSDIIKPLWEKDPLKVVLFSSALSENVDHNPQIQAFRNECGEFLIRLAKYYEKLKKILGKGGKTCPSRIAKTTQIQNTDILFDSGEFFALRNEALALIDICNLFIEEAAFSYEVERSAYVVYSKISLPDTIMHDVHRLDFSGRTISGNHLAVLWLNDSEKTYSEQIHYIIKMCNGIPVQIINCHLRSWIEGVILCPQTQKARGNYFDRLVQSILFKEQSYTGSRSELLICSPKEEPFSINEISDQLTFYEQYAIANNYVVERYGICVERKETPTVMNMNQYFFGKANSITGTSGNAIINDYDKSENQISPQLEKELAEIRKFVEHENHNDKEEICQAIDDYTNAPDASKRSFLLKALDKIRMLGEAILIKVAATNVAELIKEVDWSKFIAI